MKHKLLLPIITSGFLFAAVSSQAATITFEADQGYTIAAIAAATNGGLTNSPYDGQQGWSRSTSNDAGRIVATTTSGEYGGGQALSVGNTSNTYLGGKRMAIELTGYNSITFDARPNATIGVGFLGDAGGNNLFDQAETGMAIGTGLVSGTQRFQVRYAGFGAQLYNPAAANRLIE
ncbi:MAG: hypothetical protein MUF04_08975 [Akkermansiaceae bacterium]|jgi:hypothetical protein|nr:hypothetical protein [Akkermansiaceae bacterium]